MQSLFFHSHLHYTSRSIPISIPDVEYLYETIGGASFRKGSCGGSRISSSAHVILEVPQYGPAIGDIRVVAGESPFHVPIKMQQKCEMNAVQRGLQVTSFNYKCRLFEC